MKDNFCKLRFLYGPPGILPPEIVFAQRPRSCGTRWADNMSHQLSAAVRAMQASSR